MINIFKPKCIIVGRTNVGKSTLFNRLAYKRISIAHETPGATRDYIIREATFLGNTIDIVDSGGLDFKDIENPFQRLVCDRVINLLEEQASLVLFVVSAKEGLSAPDYEVAEFLRKLNKPVLMVVNKVDHDAHNVSAYDCLRFGFKNPVFVSAAQITGLNELKSRILQELNLTPKIKPEEESFTLVSNDDLDFDHKEISIAVVGKPNSGKSTFVNALLNEDRVMTSNIPGTTVDAVDTYFKYAGKEVCLIDTAGIRKKRSISEEVEKMAVARSFCALDRAQISIFMLNAKDGITEQDQKIAGLMFEKKRACIVAVNQWDENITSEVTQNRFIENIKFSLPFLAHAPVVFLSAKYKQNIFLVVDLAMRIAPRFHSRINTSKLNRAIEKAQENHPVPVINGIRAKMFFATQTDTAPPTFAISCSHPRNIHFSYKRYLNNFLRENLDLKEVPVRLIFRAKDASSSNVSKD